MTDGTNVVDLPVTEFEEAPEIPGWEESEADGSEFENVTTLEKVAEEETGAVEEEAVAPIPIRDPKPQRMALYNPDWLIFRAQLLRFVDPNDSEANLAEIAEYLGADPSVTKLWQVLNLLNSTRMGLAKSVGMPHVQELIEYRNQISDEYKAAKAVINAEFEVSDPGEYHNIAADPELWPILRREYMKLARRLNTYKDKPRPELRRFIELCDRALDDNAPANFGSEDEADEAAD